MHLPEKISLKETQKKQDLPLRIALAEKDNKTCHL